MISHRAPVCKWEAVRSGNFKIGDKVEFYSSGWEKELTGEIIGKHESGKFRIKADNIISDEFIKSTIKCKYLIFGVFDISAYRDT